MDEVGRHKKQLDGWLGVAETFVVEIGKKLKHLPTLEIEKIKQHLQVKSLTNVASVSSTLSRYRQIIQRAVLEDYLKNERFVVTEKAQFEYEGGEPGAFEYGDLEIEVGKTIKIIGYGHLFLAHEKTSQRFVLQLEELSYGQYKIRVFAKNGSQDDALKVITGLAEYANKNNILRGKKITPLFRHIKVNPAHNWESVILDDATKNELQQNVDLLLKNVDLYKKNDLTFKRGLILKGPPGTGKTLIGKVLCNVVKDTTFIWVTPGDLDDAQRVKTICELARELSPSILFLEDIDLYGGHREHENRGMLGELMNQLDGLIENEFVIVIATTNRPDEIEDALRNRPGRFDRVIDVPLPDEDCRARMFELFLSKLTMKVKSKAEFIELLAMSTNDFTGAHVRELVNSAIISAIDEGSVGKEGKVILKVKHFNKNIDLVKQKKITVVGFNPNNRVNTPVGIEDDDGF